MLKQKGIWNMMNEYVKSPCANPYYALQACLRTACSTQYYMKGVSIFEKLINRRFKSQWETEGSRRASGNITGQIEQSN